MTARLLIVADDLTGALDTGVAFTAVGPSVVVAVTPEALSRAAALRPEVLVVNTASRALAAADAAATMRQVVEALGAARPDIAFKKIDSRLKGNIGVEVGAFAAAMGMERVLVAPAAPDQGRMTRAGAVVGAGVATSLPIAPLFAGSKVAVDIADAETDADLDRIVEGVMAQTLLVGTRGLGAALARRMGRAGEPFRFAADEATLFAFGTRDPITLSQLEALAVARPDVSIVDLDQGELAGTLPRRLPAVLRCTGEEASDPTAVAQTFAAAVVAAVTQMRPRTLVLGGGDTALAVLMALGAEVVRPLGEASPGVVACEIASALGALRCLVKSGGFGSVEVLAGLLDSQALGKVAAG